MEHNTDNVLIRQEYISRINHVQDYIQNHIADSLTLEELAVVSGFSKFHFHRIFKSIVNESLYKYINRVRIEKVASYLLHKPQKPITDIALKFGFTNSSMFSRSFKKFYGMSATEYRLTYSKNSKVDSKNSKPDSKDRKDHSVPPSYNESVLNNNWRYNNMSVKGNVEVKVIEEMPLIYVRHMGPYKNNSTMYQQLIGKLMTWAQVRGLVNEDMMLLAIYHDNPDITEEEKQRTSICLVVPEDTEVDGDIGKMTIASGKYAIGHFEIDTSEYGEAWNYVYAEWLPGSGYQPNDGECFEVYRNDPNTHPEKKHLVDIYMPVKPL